MQPRGWYPEADRRSRQRVVYPTAYDGLAPVATAAYAGPAPVAYALPTGAAPTAAYAVHPGYIPMGVPLSAASAGRRPSHATSTSIEEIALALGLPDLPESPAAQPTQPAPRAAPALSVINPRKRKPPAVCWGQALSGGTTQCELVEAKSPAFRQHFCPNCQKKGLLISSLRVRVAVGETVPANLHASGVWNGPSSTSKWPAHRVVNQTAGSAGPKLVILRDVTSAQLPGLAPLPHPPGSMIAFRVGKTLQPITTPHSQAPPPQQWQPPPVPRAVAAPLSQPQPPKLQQPPQPQQPQQPNDMFGAT
mmetsp:Transcript_47574/g.154417  ORF Transcript_47574/g.154417 Transcript_47574/m.154417 type:complete len:306 (+) Transcript_47574:44-961(+)